MSVGRVLSIKDFYEAGGEEAVNEILSRFSCPQNQEVKSFINNKAFDFFKRKLSVTYFVYDENEVFSGIFSLTHKSLEIPADGLSSRARKKVERFSRLDLSENVYRVSAFLIAQFGKNYRFGGNVNGMELMDSTMDILKSVQDMIGGGVVYLECEDKPKLIDFYNRCGFTRFSDRHSESDGITYTLMMKMF